MFIVSAIRRSLPLRGLAKRGATRLHLWRNEGVIEFLDGMRAIGFFGDEWRGGDHFGKVRGDLEEIRFAVRNLK